MTDVTPDQLFDEDESPDEIFGNLESGDKRLPRPPDRGQTEYPDSVPGTPVTTTSRALIHGNRLHCAAF